MALEVFVFSADPLEQFNPDIARLRPGDHIQVVDGAHDPPQITLFVSGHDQLDTVYTMPGYGLEEYIDDFFSDVSTLAIRKAVEADHNIKKVLGIGKKYSMIYEDLSGEPKMLIARNIGDAALNVTSS